MRSYIILTALLLVSLKSAACLNEFHVNIQGEANEAYEGLPIFYRSFDREYSKFYVNLFDLSKKESLRYQDLSDVAYHLARLGEYKKSLELLIWLNHKFPGEYKITANLGTLYELNGQVDSAYHYIQKGMALYPQSHFGSEWVHLAILRAKMHMKTNPQWIYQNQVLNLALVYPVKPYSQLYNSIVDTIGQISYQMKERIPFTPAPDMILANVMKELGQLLADHLSIEHAYVAYKISQYYDPANQLGTTQQLNALLPIFKKHEFNESIFEVHFPPVDQYQVLGERKKAYSKVKKQPRKNPEVQQSPSSGRMLRIAALVIALMISVMVYLKRRHYF